MDNVIFCKTRYYYDSYHDFWEVVGLSDYPMIFVDEMDINKVDATYIITPLNGEWKDGWKDAKARIILWNLEWTEEKPNIPGVSEVWSSDKWYAEKIGAKYVLLGSHPGLCPVDTSAVAKQFDAIFFAYMVHRRGLLEGEMKTAGIKVAPNKRVALLLSHLCVHAHQHAHILTVSPTRWQTCAAYRLPILSESAANPGPLEHCTFWAEYKYIIPFTKLLLSERYKGDLENMANSLHDYLCKQRTFKTCVEEALA